jgi:BCCIP
VGSGLLLNQRLVNAPPQVAPPLMQALFDEISWAVEDEPTKASTLETLPSTGQLSSQSGGVQSGMTME